MKNVCIVGLCFLAGSIVLGCGATKDDSPENEAGGGKGGASSTGGKGGGSSTTGGKGGSSGKFDSGVPDSAQVGNLTDGQVAMICEEAVEFTEANISGPLAEFTCRYSGVLAALSASASTDAAARSLCQAAYDACRAEPEEPVQGECTPPGATCMVTVGEYEQCLSDSAVYFAALENAVTPCSELTVAALQSGEYADVSSLEEQPASCVAVEEKCPDSGVEEPEEDF